MIYHSDVFQGEIQGNDKSFKTFSTMPYGYRAAFVTLATYHSRGGLEHHRKNSNTVGAAKRKRHRKVYRPCRKVVGSSTKQRIDRRRRRGLHYDCGCNVFHGKRQKRRYFGSQSRFFPAKQNYNAMKKTVIFCALALLFCACGTIKYVPIESTRTEYKHTITSDSVFLRDSIFVKEKGDTLFLERYRYFYRDRVLRDSVIVKDTIRVPYPVEVVKEVKKTVIKLAKFSNMVRANCAFCGFAYYHILCVEVEKIIPKKSRRKRLFCALLLIFNQTYIGLSKTFYIFAAECFTRYRLLLIYCNTFATRCCNLLKISIG